MDTIKKEYYLVALLIIIFFVYIYTYPHMKMYNENKLIEDCKLASCNIKITEIKFENHIYLLSGIDVNGKNMVHIDLSSCWCLEYCNVGDTLVKEKGRTDIKILKEDSIIISPLLVHDKDIHDVLFIKRKN